LCSDEKRTGDFPKLGKAMKRVYGFVFAPPVLGILAVVEEGNINLLHCEAVVSTVGAQETLSSELRVVKVEDEKTDGGIGLCSPG
jgi:hypothetical protein